MRQYKIYVINLARDQERRKFITKQLEALKLEYTILNAIYGNSLTTEEYNLIVNTAAIAHKAKWLTRGAIGCALSHYEVYKHIVQENIDYALVLEDDCIVDSALPQLLDAVPDLLNTFDVILMHYTTYAHAHSIKLIKSTKQRLAGNFSVYNAAKPENLTSAAAYIISKQACKRMIDFIIPIEATADHWGNFLRKGILRNICCVYPMPVRSAGFKSSIDYVAKDSFWGMLSVFIDKYKLFPLFHLLKLRRNKMQEKLKRVEFIP